MNPSALDPNPVMPFGKFKGQAIDVRTRRSIVLAGETKTDYVVDYFFHTGKFYRATIPKTGVDEIIGQRFNFNEYADPELNKTFLGFSDPFLNHAQVRLRFGSDKLIKLYELGDTNWEDHSPLHCITDFVYSVEVIGPKNVQWSIPLSFGDMVASHRCLSTEEVVFERVALAGYVMRQSPPLILSQQEKNKILGLIIHNSNNAGLNQKYYLVRGFSSATNCTSELFSLLDEVRFDNYSYSQKTTHSTSLASAFQSENLPFIPWRSRQKCVDANFKR